MGTCLQDHPIMNSVASLPTDVNMADDDPFNEMCDDAIGNILSHCDFQSAVRFAKGTSKSIRQRLVCRPGKNNKQQLSFECNDGDKVLPLAHIWKEMFRRHNFSPLEELPTKLLLSPCGLDYIDHCRERRRLLENLFQSRKKRVKQRTCFNLPNRFFYFVPIAPFDILEEGGGADDHTFVDPPPVMFDCDSFVLTSTGTGAELLMLDPFSGSLSIYGDCTRHGIATDEAMMEQMMVDAASFIHNRDNLGVDKEMKDEDIAGEIFDASVYRNHSQHEYRAPPKQILLNPDDYFNLEVAEYFPDQARQRQQQQNQPHRHAENDIVQEFEMAFVGVDAKPILDLKNDHAIVGTMVAVGRNIMSDAEQGRDELICTELCTWTRTTPSGTYRDKRVCRFPWTFSFVDIDPINKRLFVSFYEDEGPQSQVEADSAALQQMGGLSSSFSRRSCLVVYPMIPENLNEIDGKRVNLSQYFPEPSHFIHCQYPISAFAVEPSGKTLVAATCQGSLEFWEINKKSACRVRIVNITQAVRDSIAQVIASVRGSTSVNVEAKDAETSQIHRELGEEAGSVTRQFNNSGVSQRIDINLAVLQRQPQLAPLQSSVVSLHLPRHLPLENCGFVTLQNSRDEGSTLLLWMQENRKGDSEFRVKSLINVPLSAKRIPRVTYDGCRLIVFGQDHIGFIILVYHILGSFEDLDSFKDVCQGTADSGGVYNLSDPPRCRLANRIRHAALGGIDSFDSIHMTCNERLLVVNTKTGNLLGGGAASPYSDGLLVIDLEDKS